MERVGCCSFLCTPAIAEMNRGRRWLVTVVEHEDDKGNLGGNELATDNDKSELDLARNELSDDEQRPAVTHAQRPKESRGKMQRKEKERRERGRG